MTEATETTTLADMDKKQLKELAKQRNEELGLKQSDLGYIAVGSGADRLVAELTAAEELNVEPGANEVAVSTIELTADKLRVHDGNYRDDKDYFDPQMVEAFEKAGGEFFGALIVAQNDDKTYRIISGNRSFTNFCTALGNLGIKLKDATVTAQVRQYSGSEHEQRVAELADMGLANELQRPMSPVDKMRWYQDLQRAGLTLKAIAEIQYGKANAVAGKIPSISIILGYARLPDEYLDAMHVDFNRHEYAANGVQWLVDNNVPHFVAGDTAVVTGLTAVNADEICKLYASRKKPRKEQDSRQTQVNRFLTKNPDILEEALNATQSEFRAFLNERAIEAGLKKPSTPKEKPAKASEGKVSLDSQDAGGSQEGTDAQASAPSKSKGPKPAYLQAGITSIQAASDIERGQVLLDPDTNVMQELHGLLELGTEGAAETFMFLLHHGIIEEDV